MKTPHRQLEALHQVARVLSGSDSVAAAGPRVLDALCSTLGFDGAVWWYAGAGPQLQRLAQWGAGPRVASEARNQAWQARQPAWCPTSVATPLISGSAAHGVIELFARLGERDEGVLLTLASIGLQVGQFAERHAARPAEQLADAVPEIVWTATPEGKTDFYNRRWYDYTGLPKQSGPNGGFERIAHPDDFARARAAWEKSFAQGQPYQLEVRLKRAEDGAYRWHLLRGLPLTDAGGKISKWVGSATDIDDHKRAEETSRLLAQASALLNSSLDYETTLQTIAKLAVPNVADWCTVHLLDEGALLPRQLVVAHADPQKVKWARELQKIFPPDPNAKSGAVAVIRTGQPELIADVPDALLVAVAKNEDQLRILREIGFSSAITVPLAVRGRTFGAISLMRAESRTRYTRRDLAAAQELAGLASAAVANARLFQDAQRAIRVRDEFLSIASHELKTPLTPLQLQVQSLVKVSEREKETLSPRILGKLELIGRQVSRMETAINSMLDLTGVGREAVTLDYQPLDLAVVAREAAQRLAREQGEAATVSVDAPEPVLGSWDPVRLDQIVSNLVSNALKFGEGKPIDVMVRARGAQAELTVKDRGIGIAPEDQERIFERFERAVQTVNYGGLGLGLWIVREMVQRLGGALKLSSAPGEGSTFTVLLPLQPPPPVARQAPAQERVH